ncbi:MAG: hypothetical protein HRT56_07465 [Coraliomargarita sp.]|nr:hypothetical protein [Coraliomargarita sp.]
MPLFPDTAEPKQRKALSQERIEMRNCDSNAANSCEGLIHVDWADFFAQRR